MTFETKSVVRPSDIYVHGDGARVVKDLLMRTHRVVGFKSVEIGDVYLGVNNRIDVWRGPVDRRDRWPRLIFAPKPTVEQMMAMTCSIAREPISLKSVYDAEGLAVYVGFRPPRRGETFLIPKSDNVLTTAMEDFGDDQPRAIYNKVSDVIFAPEAKEAVRAIDVYGSHSARFSEIKLMLDQKNLYVDAFRAPKEGELFVDSRGEYVLRAVANADFDHQPRFVVKPCPSFEDVWE